MVSKGTNTGGVRPGADDVFPRTGSMQDAQVRFRMHSLAGNLLPKFLDGNGR
jgi:hypothetical protein